MRFLMWLILAVLVIFALRKKVQTFSSSAQPMPDNQAAAPQQTQASSTDSSAETMLCCQYCQLYIPASEAVLRGEKVFCCAAHADQV